MGILDQAKKRMSEDEPFTSGVENKLARYSGVPAPPAPQDYDALTNAILDTTTELKPEIVEPPVNPKLPREMQPRSAGSIFKSYLKSMIPLYGPASLASEYQQRQQVAGQYQNTVARQQELFEQQKKIAEQKNQAMINVAREQAEKLARLRIFRQLAPGASPEMLYNAMNGSNPFLETESTQLDIANRKDPVLASRTKSGFVRYNVDGQAKTGQIGVTSEIIGERPIPKDPPPHYNPYQERMVILRPYFDELTGQLKPEPPPGMPPYETALQIVGGDESSGSATMQLARLNTKIASGKATPEDVVMAKNLENAMTLGSRTTFNMNNPAPDQTEVDYWSRQVQVDPKNYGVIQNKRLQQAVREDLARRGVDLNRIDAQTRDAAKFAKSALKHAPDLKNEIEILNKEGKLGPIKGTWNDFLVGTVGKGKEFAKLRTNMKLFQTAMGRVHGGARGGGSKIMLEHFNSMLHTHMDAPTMLNSFGVWENWLQGYADMAPQYSELIEDEAGGDAFEILLVDGVETLFLKEDVAEALKLNAKRPAAGGKANAKR